MNTLTDQDKQTWANSDIVRRAELNNGVHELSETGIVYRLERETSKPVKAGQSGLLQLVEVIAEPTQGLLAKIYELSE